MRRDDPFEIVEIFELEIGPPGAEVESADDEPRLDPRAVIAAWWRSSGRGRRLGAVLGAAMVVAALAVGGFAAAAHPRMQTRTSVIQDPPVAPGVDALGCPVGRTCGIAPASGLLKVIGIDGYENVPVISALETIDLATGATYRREVVARDDISTIRIVSSCVPSAPLADGDEMAVDDTDPQHVSAYYLSRRAGGCRSFTYFSGPATVVIALRIVRSFATDSRVVIT